METNYQAIKTFVENTRKYPPSEIFFEKYGKDAKAEDRIKLICEELYRFVFPEGKVNVLSELNSTFRDFEVAYKMGFDGMKVEYINKVKDAFVSAAKAAIKELTVLFKKDQILQQYYSTWEIKFNDLNSHVYDMTKDYK